MPDGPEEKILNIYKYGDTPWRLGYTTRPKIIEDQKQVIPIGSAFWFDDEEDLYSIHAKLIALVAGCKYLMGGPKHEPSA
jgi:hypothetical protein